MKIATLKFISVTAGAVLFSIIFWQEKMGINVLLFDAFILTAIYRIYPITFVKQSVQRLFVAHLISLIALIINNTEVCKLAFCITLLLLVTFIQYTHQSVWYAAASAASNFVLLAFSFLENIKNANFKEVKNIRLKKIISLFFIPAFIVAIFFILYCFSNGVFKDVVNNVISKIEHLFGRFFYWFNFDRTRFFTLGLVVAGGLLMKANTNYFAAKDCAHLNTMVRKRNDVKRWKQTALFDLLRIFMERFAIGNLALKNENTIGLISLVMLNVLLLIINIIDIIYVWFGFTYSSNIKWNDFVHSGTETLIFSILLAMAVVLFFFRGNLNFYTKNKWLRYVAYTWIFQNTILLISVLLRDCYYIQHMGLAYKRIGVLVFLLMVFIGLITLTIKIQQRKTNYYLLRINGWFAVGLLVIASCINWDELVANYNIAHKNTIPIDVKFLLSLSDKSLPIIEKNQDVLATTEYQNVPSISYKQIFEKRKKHFFDEQKKYSWLSWNCADAFIFKNLNK